MDVERTMQFILEQQAKHEARLGQVDDQMEAIRALIKQGMRYVLESQEAGRETDRRISALVLFQQETDKKLAELAEAQKATEKSLKSLLDSQQGKNGH